MLDEMTIRVDESLMRSRGRLRPITKPMPSTERAEGLVEASEPQPPPTHPPPTQPPPTQPPPTDAEGGRQQDPNSVELRDGSGDELAGFAVEVEDLLKQVKMLQLKRLCCLKNLSDVTNSQPYRKSQATLTKRLLEQIVTSRSSLAMSELRFVKRIGEGGFAFVDLYQRDAGDGRVLTYAVKEMKTT